MGKNIYLGIGGCFPTSLGGCVNYCVVFHWISYQNPTGLLYYIIYGSIVLLLLVITKGLKT